MLVPSTFNVFVYLKENKKGNARVAERIFLVVKKHAQRSSEGIIIIIMSVEKEDTVQTRHVDAETISDASGRMGVYTGEVVICGNGKELPHGVGGFMLYHAPPPSLPPPPGTVSTTPATNPTTPPLNAITVLKYEGEWWQGHWHGKGKYNLSSGDEYEGAVCFSKNHGKGTLQYADGRHYTGQWSNNLREGKGTFTWPGGSYYEGEFVHNLRHGQGHFLDPKRAVEYTGSWERGVYQGEGVYQWTDVKGQVHCYTGTFMQGKPHGNGKEVNQTTGDTRHDGLWRNGEPVIELSDLVSSETLLSSRVAASTSAKTASRKEKSHTTVVHDHIYFDKEGRQILYRGLWNSEKEIPDGNGTAECLKGSDKGLTEEWKSYEGCFIDGMFHDHGRLHLASGDMYEGDFDQGLRHGKGLYKWKDGRQYTGQFLKNSRHGVGCMAYPDGSLYEGSFENGQRHGYGKFMFGAGGAMYEGEWKDGKYNGTGVLVHQDGTTYSGDFVDGQSHGLGKEVSSAGVVTYDGTWFHGKPENSTVSGLPDQELEQDAARGAANSDSDTAGVEAHTEAEAKNSVESSLPENEENEDHEAVVDEPILDAQGNPGNYTGLVSKRTRHPNGVGRLVYGDGKRIHEGFWKDGRKEGHGRCLFFPHRDFHEGNYHDNLRSGKGIYKWSDGRCFEGNYVKDLRDGYGVFTYPSGEKYEGNFCEGRRSGYGRFTFDNGRSVYEGEWSDAKYHGYGSLRWGQGFHYEGEFVDGRFHGHGKKSDPQGNVILEGEWVAGKYLDFENKEDDKLSEQFDTIVVTEGEEVD